MGNVTLPTPVFLAGGALCLLAGYLVGSVAGPDTPDRTTGHVVSFDRGDHRLCLEGEAIKDQEGADDDGRLCGTLRRTPQLAAAPRRATASASSRCAPPARSTARPSSRWSSTATWSTEAPVPDDSTTQGLTGLLKLPATTRSPWWELARRLLMAVGILVFTVLLVYFDRDGYTRRQRPRPTRSTSSTRSTTRPSR